ncbi:MAG: DUF368 domain-containing protein [Spirochaetaceae bacterium]|jgi:putative membrane protein|nr:DUF368 domain-containing protein [Spirochaetaceae bacterium]
MESIKLLGVGLILGIANVIPGVSGGTIAVVFNVYDRLIAVITPNIKKIIEARKFWLPLGIGVGGGILLFSKIITFLFSNYPIPTNWFFIGIILGSMPMLYRRVQNSNGGTSLSGIVCGIFALAVMVAMSVLKPQEETALYTDLTPLVCGLLFTAGALAAIAMIIPGISGSFLLLATGMYRTIIQAVSDLRIALLMPTALGIATGLLAGAALVRFLMAKVPKQTYGAILGLVGGSVIILFPGGLGTGFTLIASILSVFAGGALSFIASERRGT